MIPTRRDFLRTSSLLAASGSLLHPALRALAQDASTDVPASIDRHGFEKIQWKASPFPMQQVRLRSGYLKELQERDRMYLFMLSNDRLAHSFRLTAGKPSTAQPLGGWEAPDCELRGHLAGGHYLSACALMYASTGDDSLRLKAENLVNMLAECQQPNGYLGAYPENFYDRLKAHEHVWAPFYTYHKIMAGHLDMYAHCGSLTALETCKRMAGWAIEWTKPLSDEELEKVFKTEHGGMNEVMFNLYAITGEKKYLDAGYRFEHKDFFKPLAAHEDKLAGLHSNTNIPKVIGAARGYEMSGDERYRDLAEYFWHTVAEHHSFAPGGTSNNNEGWSDPDTAGTHLAPGGQECCCSYNMLKLTRHLYGWNPQAAWMDYYEKLLWNVRAGTMDDDGMTMYYVPTIPGGWKTFGDPYEANLCCTGSGAEEYAKLVDTIYFHEDATLYVNQFVASELNWPEKEAHIVQKTNFPVEEATTITLHGALSQPFALKIRAPRWAAKVSVQINKEEVAATVDKDGYITLTRAWKAGDSITLSLPMSLRQESVPGSPDLATLAYGPLVLVACMGRDGLSRAMIDAGQGPDMGQLPALPMPTFSGSDANWVRKVEGDELVFETVGQKKNFILKPLYRVLDERYSVYWQKQA
ncbi:beta-L-arabinofuranosidase domain-containing protein [Telmatobacter bradus]|uniref:glycoside hydrolase family 127 protein n=1 Tax=Telmatobacter bradus TaxID=474953 RepID=UPI003B4292E6